MTSGLVKGSQKTAAAADHEVLLLASAHANDLAVANATPPMAAGSELRGHSSAAEAAG